MNLISDIGTFTISSYKQQAPFCPSGNNYYPPKALKGHPAEIYAPEMTNPETCLLRITTRHATW